MKLRTAILSIIIASIAGSSYADSTVGVVLKGEHQLRKMTSTVTDESKIDGGFFLFVGGISGSKKQEIRVYFSWKMNDGTYAISSLPIEKFRVKFDENKDKPSIKFRWKAAYTNPDSVQTIMDYFVLYALITCKESDWPYDVTLPLENK